MLAIGVRMARCRFAQSMDIRFVERRWGVVGGECSNPLQSITANVAGHVEGGHAATRHSQRGEAACFANLGGEGCLSIDRRPSGLNQLEIHMFKLKKW